jgi:hypothetical protein
MTERTNEDKRDLLGDQMGYAVNKLLPPTANIDEIRTKIIISLPKALQKAVTLAYVIGPSFPDLPDPAGYYTKVTDAVGKKFLAEFGESLKANTLIMPGFGGDIHVHVTSYRIGEKEWPLIWNKQVEWANGLRKKYGTDRHPSLSELREATSIQTYNSELQKLAHKLERQLIKKGLPIPELTKTISSK